MILAANMKSFGALIACLFLTSLAVPSLSSAQSRPQTREGFFVGMGVGYGAFGCSTTCAGRRRPGAMIYFKLGASVNERVLLGLEANAWLSGEPPPENAQRLTPSSSIIAAVIQFYPNAESGLFLKGGVGVGRREIELRSTIGNKQIFEHGPGVIVGLGFDARVWRNVSVSPYANYVYADIKDESDNMFQIGLGVTLN